MQASLVAHRVTLTISHLGSTSLQAQLTAQRAGKLNANRPDGGWDHDPPVTAVAAWVTSMIKLLQNAYRNLRVDEG